MDANVAFAQMWDRFEGCTTVDRIEAGEDLLDWLKAGGFIPERLAHEVGNHRGRAIRLVEVTIGILSHKMPPLAERL